MFEAEVTYIGEAKEGEQATSETIEKEQQSNSAGKARSTKDCETIHKNVVSTPVADTVIA